MEPGEANPGSPEWDEGPIDAGFCGRRGLENPPTIIGMSSGGRGGRQDRIPLLSLAAASRSLKRVGEDRR